MNNHDVLTQIRSRHAAHLRACFPDLGERQLMQILCSKPQHAVYVLQQSFGGDIEEAKAAWNDFVLRYIDGPQTETDLQAVDVPAGDHPGQLSERLC